MVTTIRIFGKKMRVELSRAAERAIGQRHTPLHAELELYFSCLIRKRVRFMESSDRQRGTRVNDGLRVSFHPVTTARCRINEVSGDPPLEAMPIVNPAPFVPTWLRIDYRRGQWRGEFGLDRIPA